MQILNDMRVLLVEAEVETKDSFTLLLKSAGAEVIAVCSIQKALEALEDFIPDLVVSNTYLPDGEGCFLACYVQYLEAEIGRPIPVIAVMPAIRANEQAIEQEDAMVAGFRFCISKSIAPDELVSQVAGFTSNSKFKF